MTVCKMWIMEQTETVLQLQDNWYLVYSPSAFTSYIICLNNSNSDVFVKTGPNRIYISPSCRMCLKDQVLISDFSLRLDSVIKHYEWDLDEIAFSSEECALSSRWLEIQGAENVGRSTLNSIRQDIAIKKRSSAWVYLFSILGVLIATVLAVTGAYLLWVRHVAALKAHILHILLQTLRELIVNMIQLPQPASAPVPPQQQLLLKPVR
jgi:hypothetical protein